MVKTNSSIPQDDLIVHNSSMNSCYPLSSTCLDSLYSDPTDQLAPPVGLSQSLDFRVAGSNWNQVQGTHFTQEEEKEGEDALNISCFCQDPLCQGYAFLFLGDCEYANIGSESNAINYFNQSIASDNNHSNDVYFIDAWNHECPGALADILVSHEDFTLDPKSNSDK